KLPVYLDRKFWDGSQICRHFPNQYVAARNVFCDEAATLAIWRIAAPPANGTHNENGGSQ
ncbi:MAG: hypothetical protein B5M51_06395, partial [Anaerolinea sp. 4484_236]